MTTATSAAAVISSGPEAIIAARDYAESVAGGVI